MEEILKNSNVMAKFFMNVPCLCQMKNLKNALKSLGKSFSGTSYILRISDNRSRRKLWLFWNSKTSGWHFELSATYPQHFQLSFMSLELLKYTKHTTLWQGNGDSEDSVTLDMYKASLNEASSLISMP